MAEDDLTALERAEIDRRLEALRADMRPLEQRLGELRAARDLLLTEIRRRERGDRREARSRLRTAAQAGELPSVAELVAGSEAGSFDAYSFSLKTGGEVRLGFPGSKAQSLAFTDGVRTVQARDLAQASELYAAGWELGSPGRPGVRIHFAGSRQERVVEAGEVFARQLEPRAEEVGRDDPS